MVSAAAPVARAEWLLSLVIAPSLTARVQTSRSCLSPEHALKAEEAL